MKAKTRVNFHNRFDVVVNKKWVGYAENIILDAMYTKLCNLSSNWFYRIYFGSGTGTPVATGTTLFSQLGYKDAVTDNIIKAFPTSSFTRKITLLPSEYVGDTITEVGVADSAGLLLTHAMLKDAEGNPLSLTKSDIDVVEIYATIFSTLSPGSISATYMTQVNNALTNYLTANNSMSNPDFIMSASPFRSDLKGINGMKSFKIASDKTVDVANKKVSFAKRVDITDIPPATFQLGVDNICTRNVETYPSWAGQSLTDISLGTGDGATTTFDIPFYPLLNPDTEVEVKMNGIVTTDFTIANKDSDAVVHYSLLDFADPTYEHFDDSVKAPIDGSVRNIETLGPGDEVTAYIKLLDPNSLIGRKIESYMYCQYVTSADRGEPTMEVATSVDGTTWTVKYSGYLYPNENGFHYGSKSYIFSEAANYVRLRYWNGEDLYRDARIEWTRLYPLDSEIPKIVFNTAPAQDDELTISCKIKPMYKNENHILDLSVDIQFGEGA